MLSSNSVLEMTPIVDVHHAPARTVVSMEAEAYMSPPVSAPVSASIPVSKQLGFTSSSAPEFPSTVSSHLALANC